MSDLICPHCHGHVSRGASVCRGCQAEIEYGPPKWAYGACLVIAAIAGIKCYTLLPASVNWIGAVVGIAVFFGAGHCANKLFIDRVNFQRIYKTR